MLRIVCVAVVVAALAPAQAYNETACTEVPECLNEYQWKHYATVKESHDFCADRYKSCTNADGSDMKEYCKVASPYCELFVTEYFGRDLSDDAKAKARTYCKERLPRC